MAYSIQYFRQIKRKRKRNLRPMASVLVLILALLLRILASEHLRDMQDLLLGEGEAVAAFCEEFVKHDLTP